jgi:putative PIN family toxin of toxin-antitoxin system
VIVLDTNIVLDLFVFGPQQSQPLRQALEEARLCWIATAPMREELARVLTYRHIVPRMAIHGLGVEDVLAQFDRLARMEPAAPGAALRCRDADDQKFIDLAVAHRAGLLSKDQAVLRLARRLQVLGVLAQADWSAPEKSGQLGSGLPRQLFGQEMARVERVAANPCAALGPPK